MRAIPNSFNPHLTSRLRNPPHPASSHSLSRLTPHLVLPHPASRRPTCALTHASIRALARDPTRALTSAHPRLNSSPHRPQLKLHRLKPDPPTL